MFRFGEMTAKKNSLNRKKIEKSVENASVWRDDCQKEFSKLKEIYKVNK